MIVEYNNGIWSWLMTEYPSFNADHYVRDMEFKDNLGIATVNSNLFLRSTDTGQTWDTIPSPILSPNNNLTDVIILNDTLMLAGHEAGSSQSSFFQSNDAGLTWGEMQSNGGDVISFASWMAFEKSLNGDLYASASQDENTHFMHEKNGAIWSPEQVNQQIVSIDSYGSDVVYAVGDSGYVIVNSSSASSIEEKLQKPVNIFPNPASTCVTINIEESLINANYQLFDAQGRIMNEGVFRSTNTTINTISITSGKYVLSIGTKEGMIKEKIIIQR